MRRALLVTLVLAACSEQPTTPPVPLGELRILSGNAQATTAGYLLADTIVVELRDDDNIPIAFAPIHASVDAMLAHVTQVDALTRADGTARLVWRLGLTVGEQKLVLTTGTDAEVLPLEVTAESRSQPMRAIAGDDQVLCSLDSIGQLGCWQPLDQVDHAPRWTAHATTERFVTLAVHRLITGARRGCAAAVSGRVWCFDVNPDASITALAELEGSHAPVVSISTGSGLLAKDPPFCGLTSEGSAVCWGGNDWGALGDGTETSRQSVTAVATTTPFSRIAVGSYHACATGLDGLGWCWGRNDMSQVGVTASAIPATVPIRRSGLLRFAEVYPITGDATCGVVRDNGGVYCWGAKESAGIGASAMALIEEPSFSFPVFAAGAGRANTVAAVDRAAVVLGGDGESSWWGRLEPGVDEVLAFGPRPFLHQLALGELVRGNIGGLLCGTFRGSTTLLCGRMMTLTGYFSHQSHPEFAGFGMPEP